MRTNVVSRPLCGAKQGVEPDRSFAFGFDFSSAQEVAFGNDPENLNALRPSHTAAGVSSYSGYHLTGIYTGRILKMLWGGSVEHISIAALSDPMEPRHDETQNQDCERFQPMSRPAGYGRDGDRGDRRSSVIMQTFLRG